MAYTTSRNPFHDYRSSAIYMVTVCKEARIPVFSRVCGGKDFPAPKPGVMYSHIGRAISDQIRNLPSRFPEVRIQQYVIMPDHVHLVVHVLRRTDWHLGDMIANFKVAVGKQAGITGLFTPNFHDRILRKQDSLSVMINYVKSNPERFLIKKEKPEYFTNTQVFELWGQTFTAYGNFLLLGNPTRTAVKVSRKFTDEQVDAIRRDCEETVRSGGVLVSPFIHPKEKEIFRRGVETDANFILLIRNELKPRFKPMGMLFKLCSQGRLLIIGPQIDGLKPKLCKEEAEILNGLSRRFASEELPPLSLRSLTTEEWEARHLQLNKQRAQQAQKPEPKPRAEARPEPRAEARPKPRAEARPISERSGGKALGPRAEARPISERSGGKALSVKGEALASGYCEALASGQCEALASGYCEALASGLSEESEASGLSGKNKKKNQN